MSRAERSYRGIALLRLGGRCGLCLAAAVSLTLFVRAPAADAAFGIASLSTAAINENGTPDFQAGSHPFAYSFDFAMNADSDGVPEGGLRSIDVDLPPGLVGNLAAVPSCSRAEFDGVPRCSADSQVGTVEASLFRLATTIQVPLYNLTPPPGYVASFGGSYEGNSFVELVSVAGSGPGAHLHISVPLLPRGTEIVRVAQTLWGVPADPGHNPERGECFTDGGTCPVKGDPAALLTLPVHCGGSPVTTVTVRSVEEPEVGLTTKAELLDQGHSPQGLIGCDAPSFLPTVDVRPGSAALSPSGLSLDISLPQSEQPEGRAAAAVRELTLRLPPGLAINPSAASGLEGCSSPPTCQSSSKVGTVSADLPALAETISGTVYLAEPGRNPYGTTFAVYLVLEDPFRGLAITIPGRFEPDAATGRLTLAITDLPEFPFADIRLTLSSGPRAVFASPPSCGTYATTADLVPSTAPEGPTAHAQSSFTLSSGPAGVCPPPESMRPVSSALAAGTLLPIAGSPSSFVLGLTRGDLDQHFGSFDLTLPPGLVANLGSVPVGAAVGSVRVGAGLGPQPVALGGTVYLGGPYKGSPYSLEIVVPARVGPFDLGTIVQRVAVSVDPATAQISVSSDSLPRILAGVPLELRSLELDLDRPGFVRNPTSCEPMAITGTATTKIGQTAPLAARFQVGNCAGLPFKPKLSLGLSGALGRNGHPDVRAVFRSDPDGAALASLGFTVPAGELLDLDHVRGLCPRETAVDRCPHDSRLGRLRLVSPFVDGAIEGPVYLREPDRGLAGLIAELRSGRLRFVLHGRTSSANGRLAVRFGSIPDIPLSKAVLTLAGGRRGIVVNSRSLCSRPGAATATATAHNGMSRKLQVRPRLEGSC